MAAFCTSCGATLTAGDRFCTDCGADAAVPVQSPPACAVCGAPARSNEPFCDACVAPTHRPPSSSYAAGWTAADHHAVAPSSADVTPQRRGRRPWLVAGVTLMVLAAGGGAAVGALVLRGEDEPLVGQPRPVADDEEDPAERFSDDGSTTGFGGDAPNTAPLPDSDSSPQLLSTGGGDPAATMRAHWASIAAGDYQSAYDTFASSYSTSRSDWLAVQQDYGARVADVQATTVSDDGGTAQVEVSVLTRDAGRGDDTCNRFSGFVLMVREGGVWQYLPRPPEDDPSHFQRSEAGILSSDPDCAQTFG